MNMKKRATTKETSSIQRALDDATKLKYNCSGGGVLWFDGGVFERIYGSPHTCYKDINIEAEDLQRKIKELQSFIRSREFAMLGDDIRAMFQAQHDIMVSYHEELVLMYCGSTRTTY